MKRFIYTVFAVILTVACSSDRSHSNRTEILRDIIINGKTDKVLVVAHRGDWRVAPENSLAAIKSAIRIGVDIVEIDLQMTKDSVLVLMHDETLDRTTTGKGKVGEITISELKTLKLRDRWGMQTKYTVPTLEEALAATKGKILVNLDKADRYFDIVMPILEKTGTTNEVIMKGGNPSEKVFEFYGNYLDNIIYMPVVTLHRDNARELMSGYMENLKPYAYEFVYRSSKQEEYPKELKNELDGKALIWYNSLTARFCGGHDDDRALSDLEGSYGFLIDSLGARIIQTDLSEYLIDYLRSRDLHD